MDDNRSSGGVGILTILGIIFIVLKLAGVIHWSWWWVTIPFWGGLALWLVVVAIVLIIGMIMVLLDSVSRR